MPTINLTEQASEGYRSAADASCPFFTCSPSGMAWLVGRWLQTTGRPEPRDVRPGRGHLIRANDMLLRVDTTTGEVYREQ